MSNCKNCKMTDEFCASGDCPYDTGHNVPSKTLTEKWKNGELEEGYYYMQLPNGDIRIITECLRANCDGFSLLAPVPSYNEYMRLVDYKEELTKACKMRDEIIKKYEDIDSWWQAENQKLKEMLKEWVQFEIEENPIDFTVMSERMSGLANKTKEVLK